MVLRFEGSKSNRFPLGIGQNMYKMYIKEELQSTLILMLVKTGQQNGALKKKINGYWGITDLKYQRIFACECRLCSFSPCSIFYES